MCASEPLQTCKRTACLAGKTGWIGALVALSSFFGAPELVAKDNTGTAFFESKIRPLLAEHCYKCHSEEAGEQKGGLLLDRETGWLKGGDTENAVVAGEPESSLLIKAVSYTDEDLQMPPKYRLEQDEIDLLRHWIKRGAPGAAEDMGETEFSKLGDQTVLFEKAVRHWAFQPVRKPDPPGVSDPIWNQRPIDRLIFARLEAAGLRPNRPAHPQVLIRRLSYDLTGLPPTPEEVKAFEKASAEHRPAATGELIARLIESPAFGERIARLWLDVARYADTDSSYRPDTKTPRWFPFAFTYRDYVIDAFNADKSYDQFIREQLAADLLDLPENAPELAALGFLAAGPHLKNATESIDDWIDVTTRGLMGVTAACARCHDHKYEPVPTVDYYSLYGVFASIERSDPLDEKNMPLMPGYEPGELEKDYLRKRAEVDEAIDAAGSRKARNNNRSVAEKIMETDLARLLVHHDGGPAHAMVVNETKQPVEPYVFVRGQRGSRGESVPRRFLKVLDPEQKPFAADTSGRLDLVERIVDKSNPLTARVLVNRLWGALMGGHIVDTPSDFGLQGASPSHPELLDWLAADFMDSGWSVKRLVLEIVSSRTYQQRADSNGMAVAADPENRLLWRANRKHLAVEAIRDGMLATSGKLDRRRRGRSAPLWGEGYTRRRSIYGFIDRFNLDPTLRAFDFPSPTQSQPARGESIVAPQALFAMNSPFVIDQARAVADSTRVQSADSIEGKVAALFETILQRPPTPAEQTRMGRFLEQQRRILKKDLKSGQTPLSIAAQALYMSNEFQYLD